MTEADRKLLLKRCKELRSQVVKLRKLYAQDPAAEARGFVSLKTSELMLELAESTLKALDRS